VPRVKLPFRRKQVTCETCQTRPATAMRRATGRRAGWHPICDECASRFRPHLIERFDDD
jgi:hypothetical protein